MKRLRVLILLVGVMSIAGVAEAACLVCRNLRPMPPSQGVCVDEPYGGVCSAQCCWQPSGTPCSLPDGDLYYCNPPVGDDFSTVRYFTSSAPTTNGAVALTRKVGKLGPYQRDAAKRRIPRRCPSST